MAPPARTPSQRKHDTLNRLDHDTDAWVATAGPANGTPHLVPLSFLWDGVTILIATPSASVTSRNLQATGKARLGIGPTRDLIMIEGTVHAAQAAADLPPRPATPSPPKPVSTRASSPATSTFTSAPSGSRPGAKPTSSPAAS
jgi:pyridoxamine 5'-phosphate oxidase-like protein